MKAIEEQGVESSRASTREVGKARFIKIKKGKQEERQGALTTMQRLSLLKKTRPASIAEETVTAAQVVPVHNAIRRVSLDLSKDHMRGISSR